MSKIQINLQSMTGSARNIKYRYNVRHHLIKYPLKQTTFAITQGEDIETKRLMCEVLMTIIFEEFRILPTSQEIEREVYNQTYNTNESSVKKYETNDGKTIIIRYSPIGEWGKYPFIKVTLL